MYQCVNSLLTKNPESPEDITDYCEISNMDMKGYIPGRLFNMVLANET